MDDYGAVAEHYDQHWEHKGKQYRDQAQAKEKVGVAVLHAGRSVVRVLLHPPVHQEGEAKHQGAQPDGGTGDPNAPAAPDAAGVHGLHHGQVAVHAHARQEEDVGVAVDGDHVAAQLAKQVPAGAQLPAAVLAGGHGPQRQRQHEHQVGQSQVEHKFVHQAATSITLRAHHEDHKEVARKASEEDEVVEDGQRDVDAAAEVSVWTVQRDVQKEFICVILKDIVVT